MTIEHGFFASPPGTPEEELTKYTQNAYAKDRALIRPDGIVDGKYDNFEVGPADPDAMSVVVGGGHIAIQGYWMESDADETLTIADADADNPRIDRIVARLDVITNLEVSLEVLTGTPSSSPEVPALTQTASIYEIALARVAVAAAATSIVADNITDERDGQYRDLTNLFHQPVELRQMSSGLEGRIQFDVDGNIWMANNASYDSDTDTWSQPDTAKASTAVKLGTDGSVSLLTCAAGTSTITWSGAFAWENIVLPLGGVDFDGKELLNVTGVCGGVLRTAADNVAETFSGVSATLVYSAFDTFHPVFTYTVASNVKSGSSFKLKTTIKGEQNKTKFYYQINDDTPVFLFTKTTDNSVYDIINITISNIKAGDLVKFGSMMPSDLGWNLGWSAASAYTSVTICYTEGTLVSSI